MIDIIIIIIITIIGWEHDYVREILPAPTFEHIDLPDLLKLNDSINIKPRIIVYNVENSGHDGSYQMIRDLLKQYRITILVNTADEYQGWGQKWKYGKTQTKKHHHHHHHIIIIIIQVKVPKFIVWFLLF